MSIPTPRPNDPRDMVSRMRRLRQQHAAERVITDQHVVSEVLSKRFVDQAGRLRIVSVRYPNSRSVLRGPNGFGKIPNFIAVASASAEMRWKEVEDKLPIALHKCDRDELHTDAAALEVMRDAIALHFARSRHTSLVHARAYEQARAVAVQAAVEHPEFEREFVKRFGLYPAPRGREASELLINNLFAEYDEYFASGVMFRESTERLFGRAKEWLAGRPIEIIHPATGTFLLGDVPALAVAGDGRIGPGSGVALGDAVQIVMPVGPRSLVAVGPADAVGTVPEDIVTQLNSWQVQAANDRVAMHPESDLEGFVRAVRFGTAR